MKTITIEQLVFGVVMAAVGAMGLASGGFAPIWGGVSKSLPVAGSIALATSIASIAGGLGLLWRRTSLAGAWLLFVPLLLWLGLVKLVVVIRQPLSELSYQDFGTTSVMAAAAWALVVMNSPPPTRRPLSFLNGDPALRMARALFAVALLAFGLSHFFYLNFTTPLVPPWLPRPVAWAYFTGAAYFAAGVAILTGIAARLAAILVSVQMTSFVVLIWLPMLAAGDISPFHWIECVVTCVLSASGWVIARTYAGVHNRRSPELITSIGDSA